MPSTAPWSADSFSPRPTQRAAPIAPASVTRTSSSARLRSGARPLTSGARSRVEQLHLLEGSRLVVARVAGLAELPHPLGDDRLHRRAALLQVGARIELARVIGEHLPDRACHRQPQVGVDVDLADAVADPLLDLLDGNAPGRLDVAGVRVDLV